MTKQELQAEIKHLRWMQGQTMCNRCRRRLAQRIELREQHLRDRIKRDYLIKDLQERQIAVNAVKRIVAMAR